ncbi:indole-3-glycerol-phosphate synthase [Eubacterium ruminantium]|uniref:indole-3-glycerol-phosphate synthase n=1 Tax=Eubacterium ruminantium TaxID=42322 RepID=UPI0015695107|nr:indole-3-glycerol-phosphate synthase [Eubacterium ruminantium]
MNKFSESLKNRKNEGRLPVIVDFKCVSPGVGRLIDEHDAHYLAQMIEDAGAPAISVVTEPNDFGGSIRLLKDIRRLVDIPILRKDFIRDTKEIDRSIDAGADSVLLMCSVMSEEEMKICYEYAVEKGIEPFVETHNLEEIALAKNLGAKLVGINNRNILKLEKDGGTVDTTASLLGSGNGDNRKEDLFGKDVFLVSESGILSADDAKKAVSSGADAVLIGTAIWKASYPIEFYRELTNI